MSKAVALLAVLLLAGGAAVTWHSAVTNVAVTGAPPAMGYNRGEVALA